MRCHSQVRFGIKEDTPHAWSMKHGMLSLGHKPKAASECEERVEADSKESR